MQSFEETSFNNIPEYLHNTEIYEKLKIIRGIENDRILVPSFKREISNDNIADCIMAIDQWGFLNEIHPSMRDFIIRNKNCHLFILGYKYNNINFFYELVKIIVNGVKFDITDLLDVMVKNEAKLPDTADGQSIFLRSLCQTIHLNKENAITNVSRFSKFNLDKISLLRKLLTYMYTYYVNSDFSIKYEGIPQMTNSTDLYEQMLNLVEKFTMYNFTVEFNLQQKPFKLTCDFHNIEGHFVRSLILTGRDLTFQTNSFEYQMLQKFGNKFTYELMLLITSYIHDTIHRDNIIKILEYYSNTSDFDYVMKMRTSAKLKEFYETQSFLN